MLFDIFIDKNIDQRLTVGQKKQRTNGGFFLIACSVISLAVMFAPFMFGISYNNSLYAGYFYLIEFGIETKEVIFAIIVHLIGLYIVEGAYMGKFYYYKVNIDGIQRISGFGGHFFSALAVSALIFLVCLILGKITPAPMPIVLVSIITNIVSLCLQRIVFGKHVF